MSHGRYSRTCCSALENSFSTCTHHHGRTSGRTRSRVRQRNSTSEDQTALSRLTTPSAGHFPQTRRIARTVQKRAEHKLRRSRLKLQAYLRSDRWQQDVEDQGGHEPTQEQIEQLGTLDAFGNIQTIPRARSGRRNSDLRMISKRARRSARPSRLREVEYNYTVFELDELFGVLPGEVQDLEEDPNAEMDALKRLTEEGRVEEALWDGEEAEGVWRDVRESAGGDNVASVAQWAFAHGMAWGRRVMDPHCIDVAKKVLDVKEN